MTIYEEVEIEDLDFDAEEQVYSYPCPCGDRFRISLEDMWGCGEDIATCPSCTLQILIIYDEDDLPPLKNLSDEESSSGDDQDEAVEDKDVNEENEDANSVVTKLKSVSLGGK